MPPPAVPTPPDLSPYDGLLLLSFGGPEAPEEVMPFLRRVTAGRGIPDDRLETVAEHYHHFGGRSPINDQNQALLAALRSELDRRGADLPLLWGNRNSEPFVQDVLRQAHEDGLRRLCVITTSAYSSYSSCRQYREDLGLAVEGLREEHPGRYDDLVVDKIRPYWNHPGFSRANLALLTESLRRARREDDGERMPVVLFVTHSIPDAMDDTSGPGDGEGNLYSHQHLALAQALAREAEHTLGEPVRHELVYCSRSGPPSQPWLEPDINDRITALAADGVQTVVVAPIGFVSDHMEVVFDLDTEAQESADEAGMRLIRVPTVGTDAEFVVGLVDLVQERAEQARAQGDAAALAEGARAWPAPTLEAPVQPSVCAPGCCPNLRGPRPTLCGRD